MTGAACGELVLRSSLCGSLSPPFLYPAVPARTPPTKFSSGMRSMIPSCGESTDGKPEDSRRSSIVHHSSIELKVVEMSRAKWVKCTVSPEVVEVIVHLWSGDG